VAWIWLHLLLTFSLLLVGISLKLLYYHLEKENEDVRAEGILLGVSTSISLILITTVRMLHKVFQ